MKLPTFFTAEQPKSVSALLRNHIKWRTCLIRSEFKLDGFQFELSVGLSRTPKKYPWVWATQIPKRNISVIGTNCESSDIAMEKALQEVPEMLDKIKTSITQRRKDNAKLRKALRKQKAG